MKPKTKKNKGITLIALVITIIVMLILVGVTLSITLDENGIIGKTKLAAGRQDSGAIKDQLQPLILGKIDTNLQIPTGTLGEITSNEKTYTVSAAAGANPGEIIITITDKADPDNTTGYILAGTGDNGLGITGVTLAQTPSADDITGTYYAFGDINSTECYFTRYFPGEALILNDNGVCNFFGQEIEEVTYTYEQDNKIGVIRSDEWEGQSYTFQFDTVGTNKLLLLSFEGELVFFGATSTEGLRPTRTKLYGSYTDSQKTYTINSDDYNMSSTDASQDPKISQAYAIYNNFLYMDEKIFEIGEINDGKVSMITTGEDQYIRQEQP